MKIVLIIVAVLAGIVAIVTIVGYALPVRHVASRERVLPAPPDVIFAAISDPAGYIRWRTGVKEVQLLPPVESKPSFREAGSDGTITYIFDEITPHSRIVSRIADTGLPFGGSWTYELAPHDSGTHVRITERGEVYNPIFRFISRFVMGHHRTIDIVLRDLDAFARSRSGG